MRYFITGTDTDCGKSLIAQCLMLKARGKGLRVVGMKPVAAGASQTVDGLRNQDALQLQSLSSKPIYYQQINPYCFEPAMAPHLAAAQAGINIEPEPILEAADYLGRQADLLVVEGAGGWRVPLAERLDMAGLCKLMQTPVILVVGMRLGCLNHALLTVESIQHSGCTLAGWVANQIDPGFSPLQANLDSLGARINAPMLGFVPFLEPASAQLASTYLQADSLF